MTLSFWGSGERLPLMLSSMWLDRLHLNKAILLKQHQLESLRELNNLNSHWNTFLSPENSFSIKLRCSECIKYTMHDRYLLGPYCELDSREGHQLCHWEQEFAGWSFSSPIGGQAHHVLKRCATLYSHTPVDRTKVSLATGMNGRDQPLWGAAFGGFTCQNLVPTVSPQIGSWETER